MVLPFPRDSAPCMTERHEEAQILACSSAGSKGVLHYVQNFLEWVWQLLVVTTRGIEVSTLFSPFLLLTPAAVASKRLLHHDALSDLSWQYFLWVLQALGPAWQKLGQWAATRRDLFPVHICDRLSTLHDHGFSHHWKYTHQMLVEAFGEDYQQRGLSIDPKAVIGTGSAAQVYRASLVQADGSTSPVAVKVLHPRFASLVERDLSLMFSVANLLHSLPLEVVRVMNLPRVSENFAIILRQQADLRIEGSNLEKFRQNFYGLRGDHESKSSVLFPKPIMEWSSTNILMEELVEHSRPIADYLKDCTAEGHEIRRELAGPLLRSFLKMVFIDSWVHCDLHPGNVLVRSVQDESGKVRRRIVFLDAGIATSLSRNDQLNLIDLFRAVVLNDGYRAGKLMVERAKNERCSQVEGGVEAFASGVQELVSEFHDRRKSGLTLGAIHIGSLLSRVLDLCRIHGVEIDPSMASIVLSTLVLEGLGRSLQPDLNLIDFAMPFILRQGKV